MNLSSRSRSLALAAVVSCLVATGCAQLVTSLGEISKLQAEIVKEYGEPGVNVSLNNSTFLTVTYINSQLNARDPRRVRSERNRLRSLSNSITLRLQRWMRFGWDSYASRLVMSS